MPKVYLFPENMTAIDSAIQKARNASYDRIIVKISHPDFEPGSKENQTQEDIDESKKKPRKTSFDQNLNSPFECRFECSPDIVLQIGHVVDSESTKRNYCERAKVLQSNEFYRAKRYVGVPIWIPLRKDKSIELADELANHLQDLDIIYMDVPINKRNKDDHEITDMWKRWNTFRLSVGFSNKIKVNC